MRPLRAAGPSLDSTSGAMTFSAAGAESCNGCTYTVLSFRYSGDIIIHGTGVLGLSEPEGEAREDYLKISRWREAERKHMIEAIREMIDEARKKAKSKRAPASERIRWTRLAGQLIWYKDSIIRSMTQEAMERELSELKHKVLGEHTEKKPPPE